MAGGGVKGGKTIGCTDEIGMYTQEQSAHVNDIHASMMWALGLDHLRVTFMHNGRAERATVVGGDLIKTAVRLVTILVFRCSPWPGSPGNAGLGVE
jgi:hypothetical protein